VLREIWRLAESSMIGLLTSRPAYLAVRNLGEILKNETQMTGESVHQTLEPYISFGSQPTTTEH
jgi:hypothetical protein